MFLRISKSQGALLKRHAKSLPCTIMSAKDFGIVVDVDDGDVEDFMELAEDLGIGVDEYDEPLQGRPTPRPEPKSIGGVGEWRELI